MTLSWSRALYLEFFFDQTMENFLRGHVRAFQVCSRVQPESCCMTISKSAVLERRGNLIHFNPRLLELAGHYHFEPTSLPGAGGKSKRPRGKGDSVCTRFVLGGARLHHAGGVQSPGAGVARRSGAPAAAGPTIARTVAEAVRRRTAALAAAAASRVQHRPHR